MIARSPLNLDQINRRIIEASKIRLFLDYDGTLADFTPTPGIILPDKELIDLIRRLILTGKFLPAVISGRRLADMLELLPVEGLFYAGAYGAEMQLPGGSRVTAVDFARLRPVVEDTQLRWSALIKGKKGFYLEDKGCALALHARFASSHDAHEILQKALTDINRLEVGGEFIVHQGMRFLELAPAGASKSKSVKEIMEKFTPLDALPVYVGDDEMDEEAIIEVNQLNGLTLRVCSEDVATQADVRLADYHEVRVWLSGLAG